MEDPWSWLNRGWRDLSTRPGISLGYGVCFTVTSYALVACLGYRQRRWMAWEVPVRGATTGPAYFYFFVEAITAAGKQAGLTPQQADLLAKQACLGAARMMLESGEPPEVLRQKVTSPGGTTQAAMEAMAESKVFDHIRDGVLAAWRRSQELGK